MLLRFLNKHNLFYKIALPGSAKDPLDRAQIEGEGTGACLVTLGASAHKIILYAALSGVGVAASHAQATGANSAGAFGGAASEAQGSSTTARVVLKVGNAQITEADFETMVRDLEAQQGPADLSRRAIGENFAQLLMLAQQAVANRLDSSPEVIHRLALDREQILSNAEFARQKNQAKPTPEAISRYYSAHLADYDVVQLSPGLHLVQ